MARGRMVAVAESVARSCITMSSFLSLKTHRPLVFLHLANIPSFSHLLFSLLLNSHSHVLRIEDPASRAGVSSCPSVYSPWSCQSVLLSCALDFLISSNVEPHDFSSFICRVCRLNFAYTIEHSNFELGLYRTHGPLTMIWSGSIADKNFPPSSPPRPLGFSKCGHSSPVLFEGICRFSQVGHSLLYEIVPGSSTVWALCLEISPAVKRGCLCEFLIALFVSWQYSQPTAREPLVVTSPRSSYIGMTEARNFTARPLSKPARSDLKDAFRIYLSSSSLAALRLRADDLCTITSGEGPAKTAIAWTAVENIQSTVVQTSRTLQDCYGIKIGEKVAVGRTDGVLDDLASVVLVDISDSEKIAKYGPIDADERCHWEWALEFPLLRCEVLAQSLTFDLELKGQRRSFQVVKVNAQNASPGRTIFRFTKSTKVSIGMELEEVEEPPSNIAVRPTGLGGLVRQIEDINESLSDFNIDPRKPSMPPFYEHSRGILLYGPKGTGKSMLLRHIGNAGWKQVFRIGTSSLGRSIGEGELKLRSLFQEAARSKPSVILIDQLEFIAPKRSSFESQSLASVLCENLDAIRSASILVVAATRHPNEVDDSLRTPHRLGTEIELQVPTAKDRAEILRAIRGPVSAGLNDEVLNMLAEKTHGYVGADLFALLQLVCRKARQRQLVESDSPAIPRTQNGGDFTVDLTIQETDVWSSLQEIRPTAMREVFLETPRVKWSDIGGQHEIKRRLHQAVERPLKVCVDIEARTLIFRRSLSVSIPKECNDST